MQSFAEVQTGQRRFLINLDKIQCIEFDFNQVTGERQSSAVITFSNGDRLRVHRIKNEDVFYQRGAVRDAMLT